MPDRKLRLGEELISPLHALYDGLQVDGAPRPAHRAAEHPVWVVTRYRDARKVLNHPGVRRDARQAAELYAKRTGSPRAGIGEGLSHHMLNLIAVIFELLGIPEAEREHARQSWERQAELLSPEEAQALADAQVDYLRVLLEAKRRQPADDVYSGLVQAADESGQLSEAELVSMAHLLMMSGFETTMNMIGNALVTLLVNPEQLALLRAQPELLPNAMEELVRHDSPVRASMLRFTVEDVELDGVTIPAGEYILVSNLTANHDAERFDDPDRLDLTRNTDGHLGYGFGVHYCVGASLARLEGRIAIQRLLARFPDLQLAVPHAELQWLPITFLRALISVPVRTGCSAPANTASHANPIERIAQ